MMAKMKSLFKKDKNKDKQALKKCSKGMHYGKITVCGRLNCKTEICSNCATQSVVDKKVLFCEMCSVTEKMNMDTDSDEGMDFGPKNFKTVVSVKLDVENGGQIVGWDELYKFIDSEEIDKSALDVIEKGASNWVNRDLEPQDFVLNQVDDISFELVHKDGKESYKIVLQETQNDQVEFTGLPKCFQRQISKYNAEEMRTNPGLVL